ncbi:hypothetical protein EDC17_101616 [Sphingobacterium alimentarium]|uniref:Uncharacterized protein n=1 Tax=Sphingobacterium alimentarium TaxID=797292 RepID=A0A4V2VUA5_9SPHI|nr:hypothetical protein EDC17_101616 [Sphingobacterium alimentarium]
MHASARIVLSVLSWFCFKRNGVNAITLRYQKLFNNFEDFLF